MHSSLPKVLHPVLFRPMLHPVLDLARSLSPQSVTVVVGHGEDQVRQACSAYNDVQFAVQKEQNGTGHAVLQTAALLEKKGGRVLVLCGDVVLLRPSSVEALLRAEGEAAVLTAEVTVPKGYGRILRDTTGAVCGIREEADCSPGEREICEVNTGVYVFRSELLWPALHRLGKGNAQGEQYLTDVVESLVQQGKKVNSVCLEDSEEMTGINDRVALARVEAVLRRRVNEAWMLSGVTLQDPDSIWIDALCEIEPDVLIERGCLLIDSVVGGGSVIEAGCRVVGCELAAGVHVKQGSYLERSQVGPGSTVGPYAHLRPDTVLGPKVKIGNFVEVKASQLGEGSKASHLSYIGDAEIGAEVNLGCGLITCNYDGKKKHKTIIEDRVFVGSDTQLVAPVRLGAGCYIASGSTITQDVPADALAITRGKQTNKPGFAKKFR